jgi:hypothetical protein
MLYGYGAQGLVATNYTGMRSARKENLGHYEDVPTTSFSRA